MKRVLLSCLLVLAAVVAPAQQRAAYRTVSDLAYRQEASGYAAERCKLDLYYPENVKDFPTAYAHFANEISLPLHTRLTDEEIDYIIEQYTDILRNL